MSDVSEHLAVRANLKSIRLAMDKDREGWLSLYADDAIISDPVGPSPLDPAGEGHHGKVAIAQFYDNIIAFANFEMIPGQHRISGEHACAVPMQVINTMPDGIKTTVEMIAVYHVNDAGLITSMHAYWDMGEIERQLEAAYAQ